MELALLMIAGLLLIYVGFLQIQAPPPPQTVVLVPGAGERGSGVSGAALALLILLAVIALAIFGVLPALG